jgi:hypothetical protein
MVRAMDFDNSCLSMVISVAYGRTDPERIYETHARIYHGPVLMSVSIDTE